MGIKNLQKFLNLNAPNSVSINPVEKYKGKIIAIDTSILIYQYVIAIRNNGVDLTTKKGKITSHIHGIISKALVLLDFEIKPIFVFDGKPPKLKLNILKERKKIRDSAKEKLKNAVDQKEIIKMMKRSVVITKKQLDECKEILKLMGLPVVESIEEADSQCAYLVKSGIAYATSSEDMDILTFGTNILLRNLSSKRKKNIVEINLKKILEDLNITNDQFIELCILLGCDYSSTMPGIGIKKTLNLINTYGSIDKFIESKKESKKFVLPTKFKHIEAKNYFKNAPVKELTKQDIKWINPKYEELKKILKKYDFKQKKINTIINRLKKKVDIIYNNIEEI